MSIQKALASYSVGISEKTVTYFNLHKYRWRQGKMEVNQIATHMCKDRWKKCIKLVARPVPLVLCFSFSPFFTLCFPISLKKMNEPNNENLMKVYCVCWSLCVYRLVFICQSLFCIYWYQIPRESYSLRMMPQPYF